MKTLFFCFALIFSVVPGAQAQHLDHTTFLQWSEKVSIKSPNGQYQLEVHPILTDEENHSPVVLRRLDNNYVQTLLTLDRAAQAVWSPNSRELLIINQPAVDNYRVRLFSVNSQKVRSDTDSLLRSAVRSHLGSSKTMEYYLPKFVSWKENVLVLAVGGTSSIGINKPMFPYCFGVKVDGTSGEVLSMFSESELKNQYHASCRLSP